MVSQIKWIGIGFGFIRKFADKVHWDQISVYQELSEEFIREFADRVNWQRISIYQRLSEGFIREFADRVDWLQISKYQELSDEFIKEYNCNLYLAGIVKVPMKKNSK